MSVKIELCSIIKVHYTYISLNYISIAKQFSDRSSGKVGTIGWITEIDLDPKLLDQIKKIKINEVSSPIKAESGYYIVNIKGKRIIGEEIIDKVSLFQPTLQQTIFMIIFYLLSVNY